MRRLPSIDGLRAVAVLLVVAHHAWLGPEHIWRPNDRVAWFGAHGVDLFFVLSGFCLAYPYLAGKPTDWKAFAAARAWRIIPPYYAAIALLLVFVPWAGVQSYHDGTPPLQVLGQLAFWTPGYHFLTPVFWSLCVEARWYVAFPLLLWLFVRAKWVFIPVALACYALWGSGLEVRDLLALPAFMLGIFAAYAYVQGWNLARPAAIAGVALLPIALLESPYALNPACVVVFASLLVVTLGSPWLQSALSWAPLVFLGTASYSIYLVHDPVIWWAEKNGLPGAVAAVAGVATGVAFWYCVERTLTRKNVLALLRPKPVEEAELVAH